MFSKAHIEALREITGADITPLIHCGDLVGSWEMRTPESDEVGWIYEFRRDGRLILRFLDEEMEPEIGRWELDGGGAILPTLQAEDQIQDEPLFIFKCTDGRMVMSNDDTSLVELLSRVREP